LSDNIFHPQVAKVSEEVVMPEDPETFQKFAQSLATRDSKTVRAYLSALHGFAQWLSLQPGGTPFSPAIITETAVKEYMNHLKDKNRSPSTRSQALTALRRFCRWAVGEGHLARNPAAAVSRPVVINTAPRELTSEQRYVLKNRVEAEQSLRQSAIFALGYWAGLRVSEVAQLRLEHCHLNKRSGHLVIADSKGGKTRTIDLHNEARRALYDYIYKEDPMCREARDPDSCYVFTSQRSAWLRQQGRADHLTARGIEYIWSATKKRARQDEYEFIADIAFHDLRHDFAHRARAAGWGLEEIAVYLGHQTNDGLPAIATTARYTLPSRQQLKKKLKQLPG
jgi:site-specific recombinase XerD